MLKPSEAELIARQKRDIARLKMERDRALKALELASAESSNILDAVPNGIYWKDLQLKYLGANKVFLELIGLGSVDDIQGKENKNLQSNFLNAIFSELRAAESTIIEGRASEHSLETHFYVNGYSKYFRIEFRQLLSEGKLKGTVGMVSAL